MRKERREERDFEHMLVVEGYGDLLFYAEVLQLEQLHDLVYIKQLNGRESLGQKLDTLITPDLLASKKCIGVIVDADLNPAAVRQSMQHQLSSATGRTVRDGCWTDGTPAIGLMVVPGGEQPGEIESLVWQSWAADPANVSASQCVKSYIACMESAGRKAHSPDKGLISALLAVRNDDDPRLGPGARSQVFDLERPGFLPLRVFLRGFKR